MKKYELSFLSLIVAGLFFASGCSTMHFDNGPGPGTRAPSAVSSYGDWHHIGVLRLVEFSNPVDMASKCGGSDWSTFTVEQDFLQGVVSVALGGLYDPYSVEYSCNK